MVTIRIDNFKDEESFAVYELPEGSSVLDLKTEIESTEGIPLGHQRLVYTDFCKDLQDNENLDFLIRSYPHQPEPTVYLLRARIYLQLVSDPEDSGRTSYSIERAGSCERGLSLVDCLRHLFSCLLPVRLDHAKERIIHHTSCDVDLDEPIRTSLLREVFLGTVIDPSFVKLFFLDSVQTPISISCIDQPFSYYGIRNGNAIQIVYATFRAPIIRSHSAYPSRRVSPNAVFFHRRRETKATFLSSNLETNILLQAKYNWDGKIMHPSIKGLPLERSTLFNVIRTSEQSPAGWVYGSPFRPSNSTSPRWPLSSFSKEPARGYFPENFVKEDAWEFEEGLETTDDTLDIPPPVPPFRFPPAGGMTFHMPISDKGHSFLKIMASYELISSPVDPTHVTMTLWCSTHDVRRVSSISLFIETPQTTISEVRVCDNEAHREEIHIDKEVTESRSMQRHFDGLNIGTHGTTVGFQGGISRGHSIGNTEKGSRVSRRKVDAGVYKDNTIFWNLKAPTTKLDEDGVAGEESITFVLTKKPVQFRYRCRVTHSRDGVEKTTQRASKACI